MNIRTQINTMFHGKAFKRPLFYHYEGGLRFELSEGGHYLNQFLTAHRKGVEICRQIFHCREKLTICLRIFGNQSLLSHISEIRALKEMGLFPGQAKEHWTDLDESREEHEDDTKIMRHYIAFEASTELVLNALWCAFSSDFGNIKPSPLADVYLFSFDQKIMIWPYDDRGMDIVGPNKQLLGKLYHQFGNYLLEYDRAKMDATFSEKS